MANLSRNCHYVLPQFRVQKDEKPLCCEGKKIDIRSIPGWSFPSQQYGPLCWGGDDWIGWLENGLRRNPDTPQPFAGFTKELCDNRGM